MCRIVFYFFAEDFDREALRPKLENAVTEILRRYKDRATSISVRVFLSSDMVPPHVDSDLWADEEERHLLDFGARWAEDNHVGWTNPSVEIIVLETTRNYCLAKAVETTAGEAAHGSRGHAARPMGAGSASRGVPNVSRRLVLEAVLEFVNSTALPLRVRSETIIGRNPDQQGFSVDDPQLSRKHFRLWFQDGAFMITDLDSRNGTRVNGVRLAPGEPRSLNTGDVIEAGATQLRLQRLDRVS